MSNKTQCPMSLINLVIKQCERFLQSFPLDCKVKAKSSSLVTWCIFLFLGLIVSSSFVLQTLAKCPTFFTFHTSIQPCHALWISCKIGSLRYGHYGLRTTVIHGEDLVRDLLRMLDSTWVSQSVVWLQATGSSRGDSRSEDYVSIFLPIFDQF